MIATRLTLSFLAAVSAGCSSVPPGPVIATSDLPDCFDTSFDAQRNLFTMMNERVGGANQQCLLTVRSPGDAPTGWQLAAGNYRVFLANGGGGGAGGTVQGTGSVWRRGGVGGGDSGGGGGGGAGALETQTSVDLAAGVYKLTLGAGGPGGSVCMPGSGFSGGPGWVGSPSSMVLVSTGELIAGTAGADSYVRPSRARNELNAGDKMDGRGGTGPGQSSGGHSAVNATGANSATIAAQAESGTSLLASGSHGRAGAAGRGISSDGRSGGGGGGGATAAGYGGSGGGESAGQMERPPQRGSLGGGGGGGEGSTTACDAGARGGHGYIALRKI